MVIDKHIGFADFVPTASVTGPDPCGVRFLLIVGTWAGRSALENDGRFL